MIKHLLILAFFCGTCTAQTIGQYELRKRTATGFDAFGVTLADGQAFGQTAGIPAAITLGGSGLTIGTTTITSGTSGRVIYNNAGTVGDLATTGSGSVVLGTSPTISGLAPSSITGTAAVLGANTFTARQTITQGTANAGIIASTGYSLTGSNATSMLDLAGTWNTSGTPTAIKINITDTASNAASLLLDVQSDGKSMLKLGKPIGGSVILGHSESWDVGTQSWIFRGRYGSRTFTMGGNNLRLESNFVATSFQCYRNLDGSDYLSFANENGTVAYCALGSDGEGILRLGRLHATVAIPQYLVSHSVTTGTGANLFLGAGTGSVAGGSVILATRATTGALVARLTATPTGVVIGPNGTAQKLVKHGTAVLIAGAVTVSDSDTAATGTPATTSRILVTRMSDGGTLGTGYSITRVNTTSFTITSSNAAETSTVSWFMINP